MYKYYILIHAYVVVHPLMTRRPCDLAVRHWSLPDWVRFPNPGFRPLQPEFPNWGGNLAQSGNTV